MSSASFGLHYMSMCKSTKQIIGLNVIFAGLSPQAAIVFQVVSWLVFVRGCLFESFEVGAVLLCGFVFHRQDMADSSTASVCRAEKKNKDRESAWLTNSDKNIICRAVQSKSSISTNSHCKTSGKHVQHKLVFLTNFISAIRADCNYGAQLADASHRSS